MNRPDVYALVDKEREYQKIRWNRSTSSCAGNHSLCEFLVYIRHYVEEGLKTETVKAAPECWDEERHFLRKIAALAVAALEQHGGLPRSDADMDAAWKALAESDPPEVR